MHRSVWFLLVSYLLLVQTIQMGLLIKRKRSKFKGKTKQANKDAITDSFLKSKPNTN